MYLYSGSHCRHWGTGIRVQSIPGGTHIISGIPGNVGLPGAEDKIERTHNLRRRAIDSRDHIGSNIYSVPEIDNLSMVARNYLLDARVVDIAECL